MCRHKLGSDMLIADASTDLDQRETIRINIEKNCDLATYLGQFLQLMKRHTITTVCLLHFCIGKCSLHASLIDDKIQQHDCKLRQLTYTLIVEKLLPD